MILLVCICRPQGKYVILYSPKPNTMEAHIQIEPVVIADNYQMISDMMRKLHEHEYILFDKTATWNDIETSYMRHAIAMQSECDGMCLVAFVRGIPAGFIFGYVEEQDDSRIEIHEGRELYISDGFVYDAYRRQGIYSKLNAAIEQHYVNEGIRRIIRFTRINNTRMREFMNKQGYMVTRLLYEKWL
jgi:GNAT superfamily N-acetyltransferase